MHFQRPSVISVVAAVLCIPPLAVTQSQRVTDLGVGKVLVAPRDAPDPSFAEAVILVAQLDKNGALGLMINRRTRVPLSRVLDKFKAASNRSDPAYLGGPVDLAVVLALLRTATSPDNTPPVMPGTYLVSTRSALERTLAAGAGPREFHVYVGYCGWGPGQLENEIKARAWYIFTGDADLVFDSDPGTLWSRLIDRSEQRFARTAPPIVEAIGDAHITAPTR
jgi:putative transcriptional regulator